MKRQFVVGQTSKRMSVNEGIVKLRPVANVVLLFFIIYEIIIVQIKFNLTQFFNRSRCDMVGLF